MRERNRFDWLRVAPPPAPWERWTLKLLAATVVGVTIAALTQGYGWPTVAVAAFMLAVVALGLFAGRDRP